MDNHLIRFQKKKLLFLDFETFNVNLHSDFNLPWQTGLIFLETIQDKNGKIKNNEVARHDLYVRWDSDLKISKEAKRITKYSEKRFQQRCIPEKEAFETLYYLVEKCDHIVGHNVLGFDIYLLRNWYKKHKKDHGNLPYKVLDTFALAKSIALDYSYKNSECNMLDFQMKMINIRKKGLRTSLGALGKAHNLQHDESKLHDALADLELNIKVWDKLKYQIDY
tara:strand:- start:7358 stop:8023 length:666 start_codon:yes stop_codon:yes gene_type:complete